MVRRSGLGCRGDFQGERVGGELECRPLSREPPGVGAIDQRWRCPPCTWELHSGMTTHTTSSEVRAEEARKQQRGAASAGSGQGFWTVNNFASSRDRSDREVGTELLCPIERRRLSGSVQLRCIGQAAVPPHATTHPSRRRHDRYTATGSAE